jgi:hypothetical protein
MDAAEIRITALVGPLYPEERSSLFGRRSAIRAVVSALGEDQYLPDPPPIEQDASLRYAAVDEERRARRIARLLGSMNPAASNGAGTLRAKPGRSQKRRSAETPET